MLLHVLVVSDVGYTADILLDWETWVVYCYWYLSPRPSFLVTLLLLLVTSYRNPGFVSSADLNEQKPLSDEVPSDDRSHKPDSDSKGFTLSPERLMETLNSPKNVKFIKEILDLTSVPPSSPKQKYHKLTEPAGEIEISTSPKAVLFDSQPQLTASKRADSGITDEEAKDDLRAPQNSVIFIPENLRSEDFVVVERRHCSVCGFEQPLRTKHCKDCAHCVALHDHHCPWLGTCVGERNRFWFYWYLVGECGLLWSTLVVVRSMQTICSFEAQGMGLKYVLSNILRVAACAVIVLFGFMVTSLLCFHSYLAVANQTTCSSYLGESMSWDKISYLKSWPSRLGSPFSQGWKSNLKFYCCERFSQRPKEWLMPTRLPATTHV